MDDAGETPGAVDGLEILSVRAGYPGARAGLSEGDRIVAAGPYADGAELDPVRWLLLEVEEGSLGPTALTVVRDGREVMIELPPAAWGVTVAPPLPRTARRALDELPDDQAADVLRQETSASPALTRAWVELAVARSEPREPARRQALDAALEAALESAGAAAADGQPRAADEIHAWAWWQRGLVERRHRASDAAFASLSRAIDHLGSRPLAAASALTQRGIVRFTGDQRLAQADFEAAAARIREVTPRSMSLAVALSLAAQCQANRNELEEARGKFEAVLALVEELDPGHHEDAQAHYQLGRVAQAGGDLAAAARHYRTAVEQFETAGLTTRDAGTALMGMGNLASVRGDLIAADDRYRRALGIFEVEAKGAPHHIWALRGVADIAKRRGQLATAESVLTEALALASKIGDGESRTTAEVLWGLAETAEERGRPQEALAHLERAFAIFQRLMPESSTTINLQTELGRMAIAMGEHERARTALESSLARWQEIAPGNLWEGWTRFQLGRLLHAEGETAAALEQLRRAHATFHRWTPGTAAEAEILHQTGRVLRELDRPEEALAAFAQGVAALEHQLPRLGAPESRAKARAKHRALYDAYIDLLIERGHPGEAFHLLERSRARALLAMLAERDLVFRSALPEGLDRRRRRARSDYEQALQRAESLSDASPAAEVAAAVEGLRLAREGQERVRQRIRQGSPRLAGLADPRPLTAEEAAGALDEGTVALAYQVGEEKSWVFALEKGAPLRVEPLTLGGEELSAAIDRYRLLLQSPPAGAGLAASGGELTQLLLGPFADLLAGAERLLIVPDGPLHLLPFAALPSPAAARGRPASGGPRYLVAELPVHVAISITLFRQLSAQRTSPSAGESTELVAFGDPALTGDETTAVRRAGVAALEPLPAARREVESIAELFPHRATTYVGPAATEARAKRLDPATRYLHFATHSLLDERMPLDSAMVLAPGGDSEDGLLRAWEIFEELEIAADLVTLSACESALGSELPGEGLIGLTRAFHYAGARSVLASSWPVSDRSTAELMRRLYEGLGSGLAKDEALRRAQLRLLEAPLAPVEPASWWQRLTRPLAGPDEGHASGRAELDASHPFYWAAFQVYGDWR